jgi:hypothetical protein
VGKHEMPDLSSWKVTIAAAMLAPPLGRLREDDQ